MKVQFYCGGFETMEDLPDDYTENDITKAFDTWLYNRSDVGWYVVEGEPAK